MPYLGGSLLFPLVEKGGKTYCPIFYITYTMRVDTIGVYNAVYMKSIDFAYREIQTRKSLNPSVEWVFFSFD